MAEDKKRRGRRGDGALYKGGDGYWTAVIELPPVAGVRRRKKKRSKDRAVAAAALREWRDQLRKSGDLRTTSPTVEAWFRRWLKVYVEPNLRPRTLDTYRSYTETYIIPALGPRTRLDRINIESVRAISAFIESRGLSSTTARNAHHYAAKALDAAMREGHIYTNPARLLEPPRKAVKHLDVLTLPEALHLLEALVTRPDRALWATYLLTGARRGEILGLQRERVNEEIDLSWQLQRLIYMHGCGGGCGFKRAASCPQAHLSVPADYEHQQLEGGLYLTRPKSRAGQRVVPLVEPLRSILVRHMVENPDAPHDLVFSERGRPMDPDVVTNTWIALMRETFGEERSVRLHDLRHTAVDLLYMAGVPEDLISEIVGHSTRTMTRQYKSRSDNVRLRAAMEQLSGLLTQPETVRTPEIGS